MIFHKDKDKEATKAASHALSAFSFTGFFVLLLEAGATVAGAALAAAYRVS